MLLSCLGVNSEGNCYILDAGDECIILDAGVSLKDVKIALDFNVSKISGVLVTHAHSDHDKYSKNFMDMGIPVIRPFDDNHKNFNLKKGSRFKAKAFALKNARQEWVHTNNDSSECPIYGYYITHPNLGSLVYATDCEVIRYLFPNVNHFLVESNYDMDVLENDGEAKANHVFRGHHSLQACQRFIEANKSDDIRNVILCHLSQVNGDAEGFKDKVQQTVPCPVYVAKRGLKINLEKEG